MNNNRTEKILWPISVLFFSSIFFFTIKTVPLSVYFMIIDLLLLSLILKYSVRKNRYLFCNVLMAAGANIVSYIGVRAVQENIMSWHFYGRNWYIYLLFCGYIGEVLWIISALVLKKKCSNIQAESRSNQGFVNDNLKFSPWFIESRKWDLLRLEEYLTFSNVVGVNGAWGTGKTCLLEEFERRHEKEIYLLRVDVLTCNLDEVDLFLLQEMERILRKERIYPRYSKELRSIMTANSILKEFQQFWGETEDIKAKVLDLYREDIAKLKKIVLVVIEDLDRIQNVEQIKKLLDFAERLSGGNIRIVYEYDSENLAECGMKREYLEKYIPYVVNLTNISFWDAIRYYMPDETKCSKYHFLTAPVFLGVYAADVFGFDVEMSIRLDNPSLRKVKHFLRESGEQLQKREFGTEKKQKTVLAFYFMKHFFPDFYEGLTLLGNCIDEIKFEVPQTKEQYSLQELMNQLRRNQAAKGYPGIGLSKDMVKEMFSAPNTQKNQCGLILLKLLGYNIQNMDEAYRDKKKVDEGEGKRIDRVYEYHYMRSVEALKHAEENDKVSALIRNLHANGKQKDTQAEQRAKVFVAEVLDQENQAAGWKRFEQSEEGVFLMGIDEYVELAKSLRLLLESEEWQNRAQDIWYRFAVFYNKRQKHQITPEYIAMCNYIDARSCNVFLEIIKNFNEMEIIGRMPEEKMYLNFLKKYSQYAWYIGFLERYEEWKLDVNGKRNPVLDYLRDIIWQLQQSMTLVSGCGHIRANLEDVLCFFMKNQELVKTEQTAGWENSIQVQGSIYSQKEEKYVDEETYKKLEKMAESDLNQEEFDRYLDQVYAEEKLSVREVKALYRRYEKHKKMNEQGDKRDA